MLVGELDKPLATTEQYYTLNQETDLYSPE